MIPASQVIYSQHMHAKKTNLYQRYFYYYVGVWDLQLSILLIFWIIGYFLFLGDLSSRASNTVRPRVRSRSPFCPSLFITWSLSVGMIPIRGFPRV